MKKILMACSIIGGLVAISNDTQAQTGTMYGTTKQRPNGSIGGITTSCPSSRNICTENKLNPDGTHTVTIHLYDYRGIPSGTVVLQTRSGSGAYKPDLEDGYINDVETTDGVLFGKAE